MRRIWSEPLVHFLAIGALMFAAYALVTDRTRDPQTVVVGQAHIAMMTATFERTWQRSPTPDEMKSLVDAYVREEILYREGVAMGLDRDDQLIRRRVRQRVESLAESMHGAREPSDAVLQAYLDQHAKRFASPPRVTFRQVYLGASAGPDTAALLARLDKLGDSDAAAELGRTTQLEARIELAPSIQIERAFGRQFARSVVGMPVNAWQGPVASEYGLHLVRVSERIEARAPALGEVRELVKREWQREALEAANERYYEGLRARYAVRVENQSVAAVK
jgi:hypothetical protein